MVRILCFRSTTPIVYTVSCFPAPTCFDPLSANAFDIGEDSAFVAVNDTNSTFQEFLIEYGPVDLLKVVVRLLVRH